MRIRLSGPGDVRWQLDVPGAEPEDHELVGAWLHRIFAEMRGEQVNPADPGLLSRLRSSFG